jgi:hypothetical protein
MVTLVTFPGSRREQVALLSAVARHCECRRDDDIVQTTCVAHKLLLDERVLKHLVFYRRSQDALRRGEWLKDPRWGLHTTTNVEATSAIATT